MEKRHLIEQAFPNRLSTGSLLCLWDGVFYDATCWRYWRHKDEPRYFLVKGRTAYTSARNDVSKWTVSEPGSVGARIFISCEYAYSTSMFWGCWSRASREGEDYQYVLVDQRGRVAKGTQYSPCVPAQ